MVKVRGWTLAKIAIVNHFSFIFNGSDDSSSGTSASCENSSTRKIRGARVQQLDVNGFRKQNRQRGRSDSADAVGI